MLQKLIELGLNNPYLFTITGYENQYAAVSQFDSTEWIHKMTAPTLVVGGDQDLIFSESVVKRLVKCIPHAKYYSFHDCGHLPLMEYPEQFAELVKNFISEY